MSWSVLFLSQLETETNEKLQNCYTKLMQAGADRKQSEKEMRFKETLSTLKRIFPGNTILASAYLLNPFVDLCSLCWIRCTRTGYGSLQTDGLEVPDRCLRRSRSKH